MNYRKSCLKAVFAAFLLFSLILTGCAEDETGVEIVDDEKKLPPPVVEVPNTEIESWNIGTADNLFHGGIATAQLSQYHIASATSDVRNSGLMTVDVSGDLQHITMKGGSKKSFRRNFKIKRDKVASKVKAAFEVRDMDSGLLEWYLIDGNDKPHKLPKGLLMKIYRLGSAPAFQERGKGVYYIDADKDLIELDISDDASLDKYTVIRSGVEQAVMDKYGNWMLALTSGRVVHRDASGDLETRMNDNLSLVSDNAEIYKFFFAQGDGFMFMGEYWSGWRNIFFRTFLDDQQELQVVSAQANNIPNCIDTDNATRCLNLAFYPYYYPHTCQYQAVGTKELLICSKDSWLVGSYIYELGDASNDMRQVDLEWAGIGGEAKVAANAEFLYYYSNSPIYNGSRLTRIDLDNTECRHLFSRDNTPTCPDIFSNTEYIIETSSGDLITPPKLTVSEDNTVRFCGRRLDEEQLLLVEIAGADTAAPVFRETLITECGDLFNL